MGVHYRRAPGTVSSSWSRRRTVEQVESIIEVTGNVVTVHRTHLTRESKSDGKRCIKEEQETSYLESWERALYVHNVLM
jgi:hypothetical protein